jgi:hypothetical protein
MSVATFKGNGLLPVTPAQIRKIHTLRGLLHWDDETYRAVVARHGKGVESSKDLTRLEASRVIGTMTKRLHPSTSARPRTAGRVIALATPAQLHLIKHLIDEVRWHPGGGYAAWLRANMGIDTVTTKEHASRVIEGLKGLKQHGHTTA